MFSFMSQANKRFHRNASFYIGNYTSNVKIDQHIYKTSCQSPKI